MAWLQRVGIGQRLVHNSILGSENVAWVYFIDADLLLPQINSSLPTLCGWNLLKPMVR
ncbi:hypothetical protein SynMVIR181_01791 [Synechococcus sp. MVIR-18-1]|nr:hypothetical protein SynMVIR181_01791 [Synechococcus sp. MVIR-18-1]